MQLPTIAGDRATACFGGDSDFIPWVPEEFLEGATTRELTVSMTAPQKDAKKHFCNQDIDF